MTEKEGLDKYERKHPDDSDEPCPRCGNKTWYESRSVLSGVMRQIWVCKACGYPKARTE